MVKNSVDHKKNSSRISIKNSHLDDLKKWKLLAISHLIWQLFWDQKSTLFFTHVSYNMKLLANG